MNYVLTSHLPVQPAHLPLPGCSPFGLLREGAFMAMPGALTICRGLNRKCVKHTGNGPNVTNGSSLLDLFLLFWGGRGCFGFVWKLSYVMAAGLVPKMLLQAILCSDAAPA